MSGPVPPVRTWADLASWLARLLKKRSLGEWDLDTLDQMVFARDHGWTLPLVGAEVQAWTRTGEEGRISRHAELAEAFIREKLPHVQILLVMTRGIWVVRLFTPGPDRARLRLVGRGQQPRMSLALLAAAIGALAHLEAEALVHSTANG
ncbi:hypothetical protein LAZ40_04865 [Cereibacter sphaeroides]|uniref:hypothetical protein n=1 Tax=Cereibacter sphaeroides TaxID=1063 RepID=UPI001F491C15|nr:hypothetical protein [Cereibacter sphaeroides]MCE6958388.1 hypothetical protein [Cereibacter sphaeroides]MCE6972255.1 hypothetical protein [Cereibacter sphaeroides]